MMVKADHDESSPYAAMQAAAIVAKRCRELGINALHGKETFFFKKKKYFCFLKNESSNIFCTPLL